MTPNKNLTQKILYLLYVCIKYIAYLIYQIEKPLFKTEKKNNNKGKINRTGEIT